MAYRVRVPHFVIDYYEGKVVPLKAKTSCRGLEALFHSFVPSALGWSGQHQDPAGSRLERSVAYERYYGLDLPG